MDKPIAFGADIDKSSINTGQDIFDDAHTDIPHLMLATCHNQLLNLLFSENRCNAILLSDDDLPWHR